MNLIHGKQGSQPAGKNPKIGSNAPYKENFITKGGIDTCVDGFENDAGLGVTPARLQYGAHKKPGSENFPIDIGGRKGAPEVLRKKL